MNLVDTVYTAKKISKISHKARPLLLEFNSQSDVNMILKSKIKLRNNDRWRKVFIEPDKTLLQRTHMKNLRIELLKKRSDGDNNWIIKYINGDPALIQKN